MIPQTKGGEELPTRVRALRPLSLGGTSPPETRRFSYLSHCIWQPELHG